MPFDLGDNARLAAECTDPDGTLTTAGTATLTITLPDGTTVTPTVAAPATPGEYSHDYVTEQPGRHAVRWVFSDPASAYTDVFDVRPEVPPLILSLADAKQQLNISNTRNDEEIRGWLEAVTGLVENLTGIAVRQTFTETKRLPRSGARCFALNRTPVISLTSATELYAGTAVDVDGLDVDEYGVVSRLDATHFCEPVRVTYTAGREVIPANITKAAAIILQHIWRTQNGVARGPILGGDDGPGEMVPGFGYSVPNRALQLMEPHRLPPGIA